MAGSSRSGLPERLLSVADLPVLRPFEEIVAEYGPTVLRVCRAVLGPVEADDAWSETFLSALKAYPELDAGANIEAWLVTIAHRKAIDATRARARRPVAVAHVPELAHTPAPPAELPDDSLWDTLASLPAKQRTALAYRYVAGLPYKDIAAITGGSTEAARRAAADGLKRLRTQYCPTTEVEGEERS